MNEEILLAVDILREKAYNSGCFIPVKLSECTIPPHDIGAGKTLQDIHCLNLYDEDWDKGMERLIDVIKKEENTDENYEGLWDKIYIYKGLKSIIEIGDGTGFHNKDLGHPVYVIGATGEDTKAWEYADSPEKNRLFNSPYARIDNLPKP